MLRSRSPLKRKTPLRAKKWGIGRRSPKSSAGKLARASTSPITTTRDNPARVAWLHTEPCSARRLPGHRCVGVITVNHQREGAGVGMKSSDNRTHALCANSHVGDGLANLGECFKGWNREDVRAFVTAEVAAADVRWESFAAFARCLPCAAGHLSACEGDVDALAIGAPLCAGHAEAWRARRAPFGGWRPAERFEWQDEKVRWAARAWREGDVTMAAPLSVDERRALVAASRAYCDSGESWCREGCVHEVARKQLREYREPAGRAS